ncbi:MAG: group II intron maturase-specific domain-containing protein [Methylococcales bacterium]
MRKKSLKSFKDKLRAKTRRTRGISLQAMVADLNPTLRGWFGYFKHACPDLRSNAWMDFSDAACGHGCANGKSAPDSGAVTLTTNAGRIFSSRLPGCSSSFQPGKLRGTPEAGNCLFWRAVCGKTACTVRREGSR